MTRSEEELHLETAWRPHTQVRLRKYNWRRKRPDRIAKDPKRTH